MRLRKKERSRELGEVGGGGGGGRELVFHQKTNIGKLHTNDYFIL